MDNSSLIVFHIEDCQQDTIALRYPEYSVLMSKFLGYMLLIAHAKTDKKINSAIIKAIHHILFTKQTTQYPFLSKIYDYGRERKKIDSLIKVSVAVLLRSRLRRL